MRVVFLAIMLLASSSAGCRAKVEGAQSVGSQKEACQQLTTAVSTAGHFDKSKVAGCDVSGDGDTASDYYILRLNGFCHEDICGSVLLGWFAVEKDSGRVFEWNVADWKLGRAIPSSR